MAEMMIKLQNRVKTFFSLSLFKSDTERDQREDFHHCLLSSSLQQLGLGQTESGAGSSPRSAPHIVGTQVLEPSFTFPRRFT